MRRQPEHGVVMVDALVALLVFAVGVVAVLTLQGRVAATQGEALARGRAAWLATEFAERWRANRALAEAGARVVFGATAPPGTNPAGGSAGAAPDCPGASNGTDRAVLVDCEAHELARLVSIWLPDGMIVAGPGGPWGMPVQVSWNGPGAAACPPGGACCSPDLPPYRRCAVMILAALD